MSSECAHPVDHCMCAHPVDHCMCAPSEPLDVCICITTTCKHLCAHLKCYIRWSTRCSYIWWTTSSPLVVIRMQPHLVDHRMCKSPVYHKSTFMYSHQRSKVMVMWKINFVKCRPVGGQQGVHKDPSAIAAQPGFFSNTCQKMRGGKHVKVKKRQHQDAPMLMHENWF